MLAILDRVGIANPGCGPQLDSGGRERFETQLKRNRIVRNRQVQQGFTVVALVAVPGRRG